MKKFLVIVVIGLLFSNISYGKISNAYYEELYDSCMIEATKGDLGYSMAKDYCKCGADHFDNNYNDKSLIAINNLKEMSRKTLIMVSKSSTSSFVNSISIFLPVLILVKVYFTFEV